MVNFFDKVLTADSISLNKKETVALKILCILLFFSNILMNLIRKIGKLCSFMLIFANILPMLCE